MARFTIGPSSQRLRTARSRAPRDVVIVTVNYAWDHLILRPRRLTAQDSVSGNEGMLDQVAALKRDNIAEFGGDRQRHNSSAIMPAAEHRTLLANAVSARLFHKGYRRAAVSHRRSRRARKSTASEVLSKLGVNVATLRIRALTPGAMLTGTMLADGKTPDPEVSGMYSGDRRYSRAAARDRDVADGSASGVAVRSDRRWKKEIGSRDGRVVAQLDRAASARA